MKTLKEKMEAVKVESDSTWEKNADFRQNNLWMDYSQQISMRIYALIKNDKELNQEKLAICIGAKPQYISRILKGTENLTLKTIYKLSKALNYELISFPPYAFTDPRYLHDDSNNWQTEVNENAIVVDMFSSIQYKEYGKQ